MRQYVVTEGCYVPVGDSTRFKRAGQVVSLDERDAKALGGLVKPASKSTVDAQQVVDQAPVQAEGVGDPGPSPVELDPPTQSDTKDVWVDFAVAKGEGRDAAEAMTKAELVDKFGSK